MKMIKGYKVFMPDWTCRGFQFEVGKTYEEDVKPSVCKRGFHFCRELIDCFNYYSFDPRNKVAEVIALGNIDENDEDTKVFTNKIQIVRELTWYEVLRLVNTGKGNTGYRNSGNCNSGNYNSGDCNSGDCNNGNRNSGDCNSGDWNSGDGNSGDCNSGDWNSGDWNSGDGNSGYYNSGYYNSGGRNSGDHNSGYYNSGDHNSGYYNSGDYNSGDWNRTNHSSGCFNTEEDEICMFNKKSDWTYRGWLNSRANSVMRTFPASTTWVPSGRMTDDEKTAHPEHETTGGYLKQQNNPNAPQEWWDDLTEADKEAVLSLPNFDADIFEEITGVKVEGSEKNDRN